MSANPFTISSTEISGFDSLAELALDMHWSWNHATDEVWRQLDSRLWEITHNPWVVLQTVSRDRIEHVLADPVFREKVDGLIEASRQAAEALAWFQRTHSQSPLTCAAYFSMEFMLSEALPIYSGGLGNVAGDQLKAASDLGVPVVGVGRPLEPACRPIHAADHPEPADQSSASTQASRYAAPFHRATIHREVMGTESAGGPRAAKPLAMTRILSGEWQ